MLRASGLAAVLALLPELGLSHLLLLWRSSEVNLRSALTHVWTWLQPVTCQAWSQ